MVKLWCYDIFQFTLNLYAWIDSSIVHGKYINLSNISFAYRGETTVCMGSDCLSKMSLHSIEFE